MLIFLTLILATWRISSLLVDERGPRDVFAKLRYRAGIRFNMHSEPYADTLLGEMLLCVWCTSFWVGLFWTLFFLFTPEWLYLLLALPFALSAGAIWFMKFMERDFVAWREQFLRWLEAVEDGAC